MIANAAAEGVFVAPAVEWVALAPLIIVISAGVFGVLVESFVPAARRRTVQVVLTTVALAAALAVIVVTLIAVAAISIATASVSGSFTSTTVPLD